MITNLKTSGQGTRHKKSETTKYYQKHDHQILRKRPLFPKKNDLKNCSTYVATLSPRKRFSLFKKENPPLDDPT